MYALIITKDDGTESITLGTKEELHSYALAIMNVKGYFHHKIIEYTDTIENDILFEKEEYRLTGSRDKYREYLKNAICNLDEKLARTIIYLINKRLSMTLNELPKEFKIEES